LLATRIFDPNKQSNFALLKQITAEDK